MAFLICTFIRLNKQTLISLFLIAISINLIAQSNDSATIKSVVIYSQPENNFFSFTEDSIIEFSIKKRIYNNSLLKGGYVTPQSPIVFETPLLQCGFEFMKNDINPENYLRDSALLFNTRSPFSNIDLIIASKKEQYFNLLFTSNFAKKWNVALTLTRANGEGFYLKQKSVNNNILLTTNYSSKKNRYQLVGGALAHTLKRDENGGITNDTLLADNLFVNKKLFPIQIQDARSKRGLREMYISQAINFGKKLNTDSLEKNTYRASLLFDSDYKEYFYTYTDKNPQSGYYNNVFQDTLLTHDSSSTLSLSNSAAIKLTLYSPFKTQLISGVKHEYNEVYYYNGKSFFNNSILFISSKSFFQNTEKKIAVNLNASTVFDGYNNGDYNMNGSILFFGKRKNTFELSGYVSKKMPSYYYSNYLSNHFQWINTFAKIFHTNTQLLYNSDNYKLNIVGGINSISNFIFMNTDALPQQLSATINHIYIIVAKNITINHLNIDNYILYQKVNNAEALRLPTAIAKSSIYYTGNWFKNALKVKTGINLTYFTSFYGNAYMPATGIYYLQSERKVGNYPFLDLFFIMQTGRLSISVSCEHFNSGLTGSNYFIAPHYAAFDRWFKIGINWSFFD